MSQFDETSAEIYNDLHHINTQGLINSRTELLTGTVPVNNSLLTGTVPVNNSLLTGTLPMLKFF